MLKELEKLGPKKGVITQSVKDVVQSLVNDDLVSKDKIGSSASRCFWIFSNWSKKRFQEFVEQCDSLKKGREESDERENALAELKATAYLVEEQAFEVVHSAANRWTGLNCADNIFTLQQWCSNNFPRAKEQLENMCKEAGITDGFDYLEMSPVPLCSAVE